MPFNEVDLMQKTRGVIPLHIASLISEVTAPVLIPAKRAAPIDEEALRVKNRIERLK